MKPGCFGSVICHSPNTPRCRGCIHSDECSVSAKGSQKKIFGDNRAPIMNRFVVPEFQPEIDKDLPVHTRKRLEELQRDGITVDTMQEEFAEGRNPLDIKGKKPAFLYVAFELHLKMGFDKKIYKELLKKKGMSESTARSAANTSFNIIQHLGV